jgi:hypothetical protein
MIIELISRIINLLFYPAKEWKAIAEENKSRKTVYRRYVVPLLCVMTVACIIGAWLYASRYYKFSPAYVIYRIFTLWTTLSAGLFTSAYLISEIMAEQVAKKDYRRDFALMAYSSGVVYLVIVFIELSPFKELAVLALYSCYLYWTGIPHVIQAEGRIQMIYGLLSFIIVLVTYFLMYFLFEKIFASIFGIIVV